MKKRKYLLFFTALLILFITGSIQAEQLTVQFNKNNYHDDQLNSYFSFMGNISYDTIDAIRNGITARVILTFQLLKSGGVFRSGKRIVREKTEIFTISYDVWENGFIISDIDKKNEFRVTRPSDILIKINEVINPLSLSVPSINKKQKLFLRVKIKIQTIKLYPPFGIFLFFFDPWNYESKWVNTKVFILQEL